MNQINFPVFRLPKSSQVQTEGTIRYILSEYVNREDKLITSVRILDDTSIEGDSLGKRRLKLRQMKVPVVKLAHVCYFLGDILGHGNYSYIDSLGKIFKYTKTTMVPLVYKKIIKQLQITNGTGSVIEVEGISTRFKTTVPFGVKPEVAGILKLKTGYILYSLGHEMLPNTRRKV